MYVWLHTLTSSLQSQIHKIDLLVLSHYTKEMFEVFLCFFSLWAKKVTLIQSVSFCFPLLGQSSVQQLVLTAFGDVTLAKLLTQSICEGEKQSDT